MIDNEGKKRKVTCPIDFYSEPNEYKISPLVFYDNYSPPLALYELETDENEEIQEQFNVEVPQVKLVRGGSKKKKEVAMSQIASFELIPIVCVHVIGLNGVEDKGQLHFRCKLKIEQMGTREYTIKNRNLSSVVDTVKNDFPFVYLKEDTPKAVRQYETIFRKKLLGIKHIRQFVRAGWQFVDERKEMLYLVDNTSLRKNDSFEIITGKILPCQTQKASDILDIFNRSMQLYPELSQMATIFLFSLMGVSYKLFDKAGYTPHFLLFINGTTGSLKTELAKVFFLQLQKSDATENKVRRIGDDTLVSLERVIVQGNDTITLLDDYCPAKTRDKKSEMQNKLELVVRMVGDGSSKSRSNAELEDVQGEGVSGMVAITGEIRGKGLSSNLRTVYCKLEKGLVDGEKLTWFQSNSGIFNSLIACYAEYLSHQWNQLIVFIRENYELQRRESSKLIKEKRLVDSFVTLKIVSKIFGSFLQEYCQIDRQEAVMITEDMSNALLENIRINEKMSVEDNPVEIYMSAIQYLVSTRQIVLADGKVNFLENIKEFDGFLDERNMCFLPEKLHEKICTHIRRTSACFVLEFKEILDELCASGIIKTYSNGSRRTNLYRLSADNGKKIGMLKISKEILLKWGNEK